MAGNTLLDEYFPFIDKIPQGLMFAGVLAGLSSL